MYTGGYRCKLDVCLQICKNTIEPFQLPGLFRKQVDLIFFLFKCFKILDEQVKVPVEGGLFSGLEE